MPDPAATQATTPEPVEAQPLGWVRSGVGLAAFGYAAIFLIDLFLVSIDPRSLLYEGLTALVAAFAFTLTRRRPRLAALITLGAVWLECSLSVARHPDLRVSAVLVFPGLATAAGLMVGTWAALGFAAATVALLAGFTTAAGAWGPDTAGSHTNWVLVSTLATVAGVVLASAARRSYEQVLAASSRVARRYAELFGSAPDGLVALDGAGRIAEANAAAGRLLGVEAAALRGLAPDEALRRAGAEGAVDLGLARPGAPLLLSLRRADLAAAAVEISAPAGAGEAGALLVLRDVTARRLMEERLGHAQRLETVGQLAGGVAHDFNNLLTAVAGNASLLMEHPDAEVRELATEIEDARRRGTALTRQLLAFARRDVHRPEPLDLAEVVAGTSRLLERLLSERHRLALDTTQGVPVLADRAQLEQVALNLVGNARDAMPEGGTVTVSIRALDAAAAAALGSTLEAPRQAMLEVADTGMGMSPEVRARIFEPFFTTKPRGQGTGLGLATVHGIAAQSGGQVAVESSTGRGARFRVFLPAAEAQGPAAEPPARARAPGGRERVLLVEDDANVRALAERILRRAGYQVVTCADGADALAEAARHPVLDLLVSDIGMPGLNGPELAGRLREARAELRVLFISGYWSSGEAGRQALDPALDVLQKPFEPDELLRRVRRALEAA